MKILGNIVWLIFGGIIIAIEYFIGSLILMITIIGIPFGLQTLKMASLSVWPFGPGMSLCIYECALAALRRDLDRSYPCIFRIIAFYYNYRYPLRQAAFQTHGGSN